MSGWISCNKEMPSSYWHVVFVTDGICTCLARWIENPKEWYGDDLMEWNENLQEDVPLDEEWHGSHWVFIENAGPFIGNDQCMAFDADGISHWMSLPTPPKTD